MNRKRKFGKAVFDFDAEDDEELTVKEGEEVEIMGESEGWYIAKNGNQEGYIPKTYIEEFMKQNEDKEVREVKQEKEFEIPRRNNNNVSGVLQFDYGLYAGGVKGGSICDGYGKMVYTKLDDFASYEGNWKNNQRHGEGKLVLSEGNVVKGVFSNGEMKTGEFWVKEGISRGDVFITMKRFDRGFMGVIIKNDRSDLELICGNFTDVGPLVFQGIMYYRDGSRYEGRMENDKYEGWGTVFALNGDMLMGNWKGGEMSGYFIQKSSDEGSVIFLQLWDKRKLVEQKVISSKEFMKERYRLKFQSTAQIEEEIRMEKRKENSDELQIKGKNKGKYYGETMINKKSGKKYRHGFGEMIWENGESYIGVFKNDKKSGKGTQYFKNGNIYEGEWVNDRMSGMGKYYFLNGDLYDGCFKSGKAEGIAKFFCVEDRSSFLGIFRSWKREGLGMEILRNGDEIKGMWKESKRNGKIQFRSIRNGDRIESTYVNGKKEGYEVHHFGKTQNELHIDLKNNIRDDDSAIFYERSKNCYFIEIWRKGKKLSRRSVSNGKEFVSKKVKGEKIDLGTKVVSVNERVEDENEDDEWFGENDDEYNDLLDDLLK